MSYTVTHTVFSMSLTCQCGNSSNLGMNFLIPICLVMFVSLLPSLSSLGSLSHQHLSITAANNSLVAICDATHRAMLETLTYSSIFFSCVSAVLYEFIMYISSMQFNRIV